ncbi:MAG: thioredoxin family protein [Mucilaginibacter sp.]
MKTALILLFVLLGYGAFAQQATPPQADAVMKEAYAKAKAEHKNVILMFHASWCGWCKKMTACIEDPTCSKFFDDNYVITYLDILERDGKKDLENPGATDVMKNLHGDPAGGIPFWAVITPEGKVVGTSYMPHTDGTPGTANDNVGCPAEDNEVSYFISLLKKSSKLTDSQLAVIAARFHKNKAADTNAGQ